MGTLQLPSTLLEKVTGYLLGKRVYIKSFLTLKELKDFLKPNIKFFL